MSEVIIGESHTVYFKDIKSPPINPDMKLIEYLRLTAKSKKAIYRKVRKAKERGYTNPGYFKIDRHYMALMKFPIAKDE